MKIFIDTSVFVRHYYGIENSLKLLNFVINENTGVVSPNVIEETFFKLLYMETERIFGKTGKYSVREKFTRYREKFRPVSKYVNDFLMDSVKSDFIELLIIDRQVLTGSVDIAFRYGLLPNDALIAATCKHHGIKKIATFDEDFKRVDFLEIITS